MLMGGRVECRKKRRKVSNMKTKINQIVKLMK
jgi:hypothetical protein